jgi:hypothetical protein
MAQTPEIKPADVTTAPVAAPVETQPVAVAPSPAPAAAQPPPAPVAAPAAPVVDAAAIEARIRGEQEEIAALCTLAGTPEFLSEAIGKRMSVAQAREALLAKQAAKSQGTQVNSQVSGSPTGAEAQLNAAATQIAASKHITFAQAYVEAMKLQPGLYTQYLAEKSATAKPN